MVEQVSFLTLNSTFCGLDVPWWASIHWADIVIAFRFVNYKWMRPLWTSICRVFNQCTFPPSLDRKQRTHSVESDESLLSSARNCLPFPAPCCIYTGNEWELLLGVHRQPESGVSRILDLGHSNKCIVVSGFNLKFPDDIQCPFMVLLPVSGFSGEKEALEWRYSEREMGLVIWLPGLATKLDNLSSILGPHMIDRQLPHVALWVSIPGKTRLETLHWMSVSFLLW